MKSCNEKNQKLADARHTPKIGKKTEKTNYTI